MAEVTITMEDVNVGGGIIKIIHFSGQLDETNVDTEAQKIYQIIDSMNPPNMILDFGDLSYMNSKSIGYVTDWYSRTAAKNGQIVIAQPQPNILDILKVVGIAQIVTIHETIQAAQQTFSSGGAESAAPATEAPEIPAPAPVETPAAPAPAAPATPPAPVEAPAAPAVMPEATPPAPAAPAPAPVVAPEAPAPAPVETPAAPAPVTPTTPPAPVEAPAAPVAMPEVTPPAAPENPTPPAVQ